MPPTPDALTRVARAICRERCAVYGDPPCDEHAFSEGWCQFTGECNDLARAAIEAMENQDE